jgi:hypothetical protein
MPISELPRSVLENLVERGPNFDVRANLSADKHTLALNSTVFLCSTRRGLRVETPGFCSFFPIGPGLNTFLISSIDRRRLGISDQIIDGLDLASLILQAAGTGTGTVLSQSPTHSAQTLADASSRLLHLGHSSAGEAC